MKLVKPVEFVFDAHGKLMNITPIVIDYEEADYDLFTTIPEMRFPSIIGGKESTEYEDVYTGVTPVGAIGSRVECTVKSAVQQRKE
jgi:hypothetical protein